MGIGKHSSREATSADTCVDCVARQKTPDMFIIFLITSVLSDTGAL